MLKNFVCLSLFIILLSFISCKSSDDVILEVKLSKIDSGTAYLITENPSNYQEMLVDTIIFKNNQFSLNKKHQEAFMYRLILKNQHNAKDFFLAPGKTVIEIADTLFNEITIKGTKAQTDFEEYDFKLRLLMKQYDSIAQAYQSTTNITPKDYKEFETSMQAIVSNKLLLDSTFIATHKNSEASPYILLSNMSSAQMTPEQALEQLLKLDKKVQNTYYAKRIKSVLDKTPGIGKKAIEFSQQDLNGKEIKLSDYNGKIVLLDFWASWCKPCRNFNPTLVKIYKKYHPLGLEILGISLDKTKEEWSNAIKEDGLDWQHVSDLQYWDNAVAKLYGVRSIPSSFLINADGTYLLIEPSEEELIQTLDKLFTKK